MFHMTERERGVNLVLNFHDFMTFELVCKIIVDGWRNVCSHALHNVYNKTKEI